jgi:two-component system sensor histidine kinase MtrB
MKFRDSKSRLPLSVRGTVTWVVIVLGGVALLVVAELATVTKWMHKATERMANEAAGVRAAERLDLDLRGYNRENFLYSRTRDPEHLRIKRELAEQLNKHLADSWSHVDTPQEEELLKQIEAKVRKFFEQQNAAELKGLAFNDYLEGAQEVDSIAEQIQSLVSTNIDQANEARDESMRLDRMANTSAIIIALIVLASVAGLIYWVRRELYRPFEATRETISKYAAGDRTARAEITGPAEVRLIAEQFNGMADTLAEQREIRLRVLAAVAHDLRNPLMALKMAMGLLDRKGPNASREEMQKQLVLAKRQIDRLDRMIGDFIDVSLIEGGHFNLQLETHDLRELARGVVELFEPTTTTHRLELSIPDGEVLVQCDATRVEQVLNNLVSNAIKYSPSGGVVRVECSARNERAILSIRDEGMGIAIEDRDKLFTPFARLNSSKDSIPGIGLGLSVTRRLVEAHGGHIEVDSTLGKGSTFHILLPLLAPAATPKPTTDATIPNA